MTKKKVEKSFEDRFSMEEKVRLPTLRMRASLVSALEGERVKIGAKHVRFYEEIFLEFLAKRGVKL